MNISIIIPTLNEAENLRELVFFFHNHPARSHIELIVVDGGSIDGTLGTIEDIPDVKILHSPTASRPIQLNIGARSARGEAFYFVHADVHVPHSFYEDLCQALASHSIGGYRYRFDSNHPLLRINSFFTRFPMLWCRGGDQTLFITRVLFEQLGGFDEYYCVMEDFDLIRRSARLARYRIIPKEVVVSARKYIHNSYLKVQWVNFQAFRMFRRGVEPTLIRQYYKKALGLANY